MSTVFLVILSSELVVIVLVLILCALCAFVVYRTGSAAGLGVAGDAISRILDAAARLVTAPARALSLLRPPGPRLSRRPGEPDDDGGFGAGK